MAFDKYKVDVPEGTRGKWRVERFTVSEADSAVSMFRDRGRMVHPGTYTRLSCGGLGPMMSDTPAEVRDHLDFIRVARGQVLIHGLGLGMCLQAVARKEEVDHVLVIEKDPDIIALVGPHYYQRFGQKIEIRQGDALTWQPETHQEWDVIWHDIWPYLCATNLPDMHRLHRRFGRRCWWQGSWGRSIVEKLHRDNEKRQRDATRWDKAIEALKARAKK